MLPERNTLLFPDILPGVKWFIPFLCFSRGPKPIYLAKPHQSLWPPPRPHYPVPLMSNSMDLSPILAGYPTIGQPIEVQALGGAGGFSGARFWRIITQQGTFCLRRWPVEYPREDELRFMHAVLGHASARGFDVAAIPVQNAEGGTFVSCLDYLWELAPWMPGKADTSDRPTESRLVAAMKCLAEFHWACEGFVWNSPVPHTTTCPTVGTSPGIHKRAAMIHDWRNEQLSRLQDAVSKTSGWPEMKQRTERLLPCLPDRLASLARDLSRFLNHPLPLQPCIRDVWQDHILFQHERVTGLVDFGSIGIDNVSCDVARLLGSLTHKRDPQSWHLGLQTYATIRPLSKAEEGLVEIFHKSGVLLGALNWVRWVYLDRREFEDPQAVLRRMDKLLPQLESPPTPSAERKLIL